MSDVRRTLFALFAVLFVVVGLYAMSQTESSAALLPLFIAVLLVARAVEV